MNNFDIATYRKNWRMSWLYNLVALSDLRFQNRWIDRRITNPAWTYVEFMESYFGDLQLEDGYKEKINEKFLTRNEYNCIKDFHELLQQYRETNIDDPDAILKDSNWLKIVAIGRESVLNLKKIIIDPDEIIAISSKLPRLTAGDFTWPKNPTIFDKIYYLFA